MTDRRAEIEELAVAWLCADRLARPDKPFETQRTRNERAAAAEAAFTAELTRLTAEADAQRAEVERLTRERDEALCLAEGPSTLLDLARGSLERGFEIVTLTADLERMCALILRNCDPADATREDAKIITDIALAAAASTEKEEGE